MWTSGTYCKTEVARAGATIKNWLVFIKENKNKWLVFIKENKNKK